MKRTPPRPGLTLVEVVVVLVIVGVLFALTLSAVQRVRNSAARAACMNQMRQIGIALHLHHDGHSVLPPGISHPASLPGVVSYDGPDTDPYPLLSWPARLLPYVEQQALWDATVQAYAQDRYYLKNPPHVGMTTFVPLFLCPSDVRRPLPGYALQDSPAPSSYVGVQGTNHSLSDGVFYIDSHTRLADVTDGLSNTLMVGERPPSLSMIFGRWYGGWGHWGNPDVILGVRETDVGGFIMGCPDGPYPFGPGSLQDPCSTFHYWSFHPGGANFLLADGSAHFLSYAAAPLMPALATRAGREAVSLPD